MSEEEATPRPLQEYRECEGCELGFMAAPEDPRKRCPACQPRPLTLTEQAYQRFAEEWENALRTTN